MMGLRALQYRRVVTRAELIAFLRETKLAVEATVHPDGRPQAAVVGIAEIDNGDWIVRFADLPIGIIDRRSHKLRRKRA